MINSEFGLNKPSLPNIEVQPAADDARLANLTCQDSVLPNHIVLGGYCNEMLGEFYVRTLAGLHLLAKSAARFDPDFWRRSQFYL